MHATVRSVRLAVSRCHSSIFNHVWISDELLAASYTRFVSASPSAHSYRRMRHKTLNAIATRDINYTTNAKKLTIVTSQISGTRCARKWTSNISRPSAEHPRRGKPLTSVSGRHYATVTHARVEEVESPISKRLDADTPEEKHVLRGKATDEFKNSQQIRVLNGVSDHINHGLLEAIVRAAYPPPPEGVETESAPRAQLAAVISQHPDWYTAANVTAFTKHLIDPSTVERMGLYRLSRAADIWLNALQESSSVAPQVVGAALAIILKRFKVRDLPIYFSAQSADEICLTMLKFWPPKFRSQNSIRLQRAVSTSPRASSIRQDTPTKDAYKQLLSTPVARPSLRYGHMQPFLDLVTVLCRQQKRFEALADDICEFLILTDRPADFVFFCRALEPMRFCVTTGMRRRWIIAYMAEHPNLARRLFSLRGDGRILSPSDLPGFLETLVASPDVQPLNIHGILTREKIICEREQDNERKSRLIETVLETATAFARCERLYTSRARQGNVMRLYEFYNSLNVPPSQRFEDAIVLTSLLLPGFEGRTPTLAERELAQHACNAISGRWPLQEVHLAMIEPMSVRKVHVGQFLADKYGPDWAALLNVDSLSQSPIKHAAVQPARNPSE